MRALLDLVRGGVGTHSIRKFASTWALQLGCSDGWIEIRGRWKGGRGGRTVNRYISVKQLTVDARVAEKLCIGGAVKYKKKEGSMVTAAFLFEFVVPNVNVFFSNDDATNKVASVLALPLLFAAFEPNVWQSAMSREVRDRIVEGYKVLRSDAFEDGYNPVKKVSLVIHQIKNSLAIDKLVVNIGEDGVKTPTATAGTLTDFDR